MELERSLLSSQFASAPEGAAATNRMDMEAAEILAALSHSKKRVSFTVSPEFGAKWRCLGRRVKKRAGSSSNESPPSDTGSNPVHSDSDLAEILFSTLGMPEKDIWEDSHLDEVAGNNDLIKQVKTEQNAESVKSSPTSAVKNIAGGVGRSRQNITEAEKETRRLHRILANRESARQKIRRRQALRKIDSESYQFNTGE